MQKQKGERLICSCVTGICYTGTDEDWLYLTTIRDLFDHYNFNVLIVLTVPINPPSNIISIVYYSLKDKIRVHTTIINLQFLLHFL